MVGPKTWLKVVKAVGQCQKEVSWSKIYFSIILPMNGGYIWACNCLIWMYLGCWSVNHAEIGFIRFSIPFFLIIIGSGFWVKWVWDGMFSLTWSILVWKKDVNSLHMLVEMRSGPRWGGDWLVFQLKPSFTSFKLVYRLVWVDNVDKESNCS